MMEEGDSRIITVTSDEHQPCIHSCKKNDNLNVDHFLID